MRILWFNKNYKTPMSLWHYQQEIDELAHHGIIIEEFDALQYSSMDEANEKFVDRMRYNHNYDMFMTAYSDKDFYESSLLAVKTHGIPTLLICYDNLLIPYNHKNICVHYDLVWLTSKETKYLFDKWGAKSIFLPYAANPYLRLQYATQIKDKKFENIAKNRIVFIGSAYGSRANTINYLLQNGISVDLYGKNTKEYNTIVQNSQSEPFNVPALANLFSDIRFPIGRRVLKAKLYQVIRPGSGVDYNNKMLRFLPRVSFEEMYYIYKNASLCLASTAARNTGILNKPVDVVNLRNFEIPMAGGIEFCRYTEEMSEYFEDGKEIVLYKTNDEMVEKAYYYLSEKNTELRSQIKIAASKRAEREHTWYCRYKRIFREIGISE